MLGAIRPEDIDRPGFLLLVGGPHPKQQATPLANQLPDTHVNPMPANPPLPTVAPATTE